MMKITYEKLLDSLIFGLPLGVLLFFIAGLLISLKLIEIDWSINSKLKVKNER